ncbi:MAG TPA: recombinase family protein, partial [Candidatus Binatus sp.]|nr:recombinase family protein [Candidatus Binatus sp.]
WSGRVRPEYERMVRDIESHRLDAILFYHPDRLTRRPIEMEHFVATCLKAGLDDIAWIGGSLVPSDSDGLLLIRIQAAVASDSSAKTSKRIRRQIEEAARQGLPRGGGYRPFGYKDDRLRADPAEAGLIREAADRILAGESLRSIVGDWANRGVVSPAGKPWILPSFRQMIASGRLSGQRELRGEIVAQGKWEPILTPDQTAAIRAILAANRYARRRPTRRYFLTGLLVCGHCGEKLISRPTAKGERRYVCANGVGQLGCGRLAVMAAPVEAWIEEAILQRLDRPELASALAGTADAGAASADRASIVEDEAQLEELARDHAERRISRREWLAARDIIEARIEEARKRLSRKSATAAIDPYLGRPGALRADWPTLELNRQRSIATVALDRATIRPAVPGRGSFDPQRIEPVWRL